jgi:hypothetical protein
MEFPLRSLKMMGGEAVNQQMLDGLLNILNGRFIRGIGQIMQSRRKQYPS